jgi:hypothetical protein
MNRIIPPPSLPHQGGGVVLSGVFPEGFKMKRDNIVLITIDSLRKTLESPPIGQKAMEPKLNREIMRQLKGLEYMD